MPDRARYKEQKAWGEMEQLMRTEVKRGRKRAAGFPEREKSQLMRNPSRATAARAFGVEGGNELPIFCWSESVWGSKKKTRAYVFRRSEGYNTSNCKMDTNEPNELQHRKITKYGGLFFCYFLFFFLNFFRFLVNS